MNFPTEIYLDMDGVCVDFIGAAMTCQGYDSAQLLEKWRTMHPGSLYPDPIMDKSAMEFFTNENIQNAQFWSSLVAYSWFEQLYEELELLGNVVFLTAPTASPGCVSGKLTWLINRFGSDFSNFIFTRHKDRLAHPNAYLIDDMPFNISSFISRGGNGVLFPQIWNELSHIEDPVSHIINKLKISIAQKN